MNWDRLEVDAFFDYSNWMVGVAVEWEAFKGYRVAALSLGPLVIVVAYLV